MKGISQASDALTTFLNKIVKKQAPEVIDEAQVLGKGTSRVAKEAADDIPEAVYKEITPTTGMDDMSWINRMDPRLKAFAKGAVPGAAAGYIASELFPFESEEDGQVAPSPVPAVEPKSPEQLKKEASKTVRTESAKINGLAPDAQVKSLDMGAAPATQEPSEYDKAADQADRNSLFAALGKSAATIGAGIASLGAGSQVKAETEGFDDLAKAANRPVERLKERDMYNRAKAQLDDEKLMRDPNSEISKLMSDIAAKAGLVPAGSKMTAMSLKNSGVNLGTLLSTIEAGKARRESMMMARESREDARLERQQLRSQEEEKKRFDKRKLVTEEIEERKRTIKDNIARAEELIDKAGTFELIGPEQEKLNAILDEISVDTAKLQDPNSVARPSEVQLVRRNLLPEGTLAKLGMRNATAKEILSSFEDRIDERAATGYKVRGVSQPIEQKSTNNNSSKMVKVIPPGQTKARLIPAEMVEQALAAGGTLKEE